MKCISCEIEINPQWTHAVEINVCPFCGKEIMAEHLKNLFASLRETMDALQTYPDQLNDWLLSNHNYIKTDSNQIGLYMPKEMLKELQKVEDGKDFQKRKDSQKFTVKVQTETGEEEIQAEKIQSEEATNDFFKRAEVIKTGPSSQQLGPNAYQSPAEKTKYLKDVFQQIKKAGSTGLTSSGGTMMIPAEMMEHADPEAVAEFQSLMTGGEIVSSLPDASDDDVPDFILAANIAAANNKHGNSGSGGNSNPKDLAHLQRLQAKVVAARSNIATGSKGSFSRS